MVSYRVVNLWCRCRRLLGLLVEPAAEAQVGRERRKEVEVVLLGREKGAGLGNAGAEGSIALLL